MEEKTTVKTENKADNKENVKKENKKADIKEENKKEAELEKKENKKAEEEVADDDYDEINTDELFKHRESIDLTPENAWFSKSVGGLISLKIINAEGEEEFFERVVIRRSFPVTAPDEFLSVRDPDTREKGRGDEIGMIRNINIFDADTVKLIKDELEIRYFTPELLRITFAKDKFGYTYWDAETTAGKVSIVLNSPFYNIRALKDGRIYINDMDGNSFIIPDVSKLDKQSYKYIEIYI